MPSPEQEQKALEDQYNDETSVCFEQLTKVEEHMAKVRLSLQRLYSISASLAKVRNGKRNVGRTMKMIRGLVV